MPDLPALESDPRARVPLLLVTARIEGAAGWGHRARESDLLRCRCPSLRHHHLGSSVEGAAAW